MRITSFNLEVKLTKRITAEKILELVETTISEKAYGELVGSNYTEDENLVRFTFSIAVTPHIASKGLLCKIRDVIHEHYYGEVVTATISDRPDLSKQAGNIKQFSLNVELAEGIDSEKLMEAIEDMIHGQGLGTIKDSNINNLDIYHNFNLERAEPINPEDTNFCYELCPHCQEEVKLPSKLGSYTCPNCQKLIINCSMCSGDKDCAQCIDNTLA